MRVLLFLFSMVTALVVHAEESTPVLEFKEGTHYVKLDDPVRTRNPSKIEVTEVFWYGCGHCFQFESLIQPWKAKLAADVEFMASPAMWPVRRSGVPQNWMEIHAKAFYTAKALQVLPKLHGPIFKALNVDGKLLKNADEVVELFVEHGVKKDEFLKAYNSFGVISQVKQADARAKGYRISGTPEMVVEGAYRVSARRAGGQAQMLQVVDFLIKKIRAERGLADR